MIQQTSNPEMRAVSLETAKSHLRVDQDIEDDLIGAYLDAAIEDAAKYSGRAINQADYRVTFDSWDDGCGFLNLPIAPVVVVLSVNYVNEAGDDVALAGGDWYFEETPEGGRVRFTDAFTAPTVRDRPASVFVELTAGYDPEDASGADPELKLPPVILAAILLTVGSLYANREDVVVGRTASILPKGAEMLLDRKRIYR